MLAKDFLEIERIINTLNIENKDKLVSSITFMLINAAGNNNTIEAFGLMQRIMSLLVIGNQKKFLSEVNAVLVKCILEQGSNEFFPALQRISENMLLPEVRQKLVDDANFVLENTLKNANLDMMSILMAQHANPQNNPQQTSTSEPVEKIKEVTPPISQVIPPNMTQTGTFQPPSMPPTAQNQSRPPMPPNMTQTGTFQPPPMPPTAQNQSRPPMPPNMTQTGTFQPPPMPPTAQNQSRPPMPPNMTQTGTFQPPPMPPTAQNQSTTQTGTFKPPSITPNGQTMPIPNPMTQTGNQQMPPLPMAGQPVPPQNRPMPVPNPMTQTGNQQMPPLPMAGQPVPPQNRPMPVPNPMTQTGNQQMPPITSNQSLLVNQIKITPQGGQSLLRSTNPNVDAKKIIPSIMQNENINITSDNKLNKSMTLTGSYNLKTKGDSIQKDTIPIHETLDMIVPITTEVGKKALTDFNTPIDIYEFVKSCTGTTNLYKIYTNGFSNISISQYINKVYSVYTGRNIILRRTKEFPPDLDPKVRIGEWLVLLGHIDQEKLARVLQLHQVAVRNFEAMNKRYATKAGANYTSGESKGPPLGNFLVDSEVINKNQLNEALLAQTQFNEIIDNIK